METPAITTEQAAWLAGVFEGEGNVYVSKPDDRTIGVLAVSVGNTDPTIVEPFKEVFGGSIRSANPGRPDAWKEVVKWEAAAAKAIPPLLTMRPHIHSPAERKRFDLALKIQAVKNRYPVPKGERDAYREELETIVTELREINDNRG